MRSLFPRLLSVCQPYYASGLMAEHNRDLHFFWFLLQDFTHSNKPQSELGSQMTENSPRLILRPLFSMLYPLYLPDTRKLLVLRNL